MANIRRRPSGSWQAAVYVGTVDSKKHYEYITRATKQECKAAAAELEAEVGQGKYKISSNITLGEAMSSYIESVANILSPTTYGIYRGYARSSLAELSSISIKKISAEMIQLHYATTLKDLAPKSIKNVHGFLNLVLDKYLGNKNPCRDVKLPKKIKYIPTTLSNNEIGVLLKNIKGSDIELPVLLALWCGMRRGEILGLRWMDINYEKNSIHIRQSKVYSEGSYHLKSPKSFAGTRIVHMSAYIGNLLGKLQREKGVLSQQTSELLVFPELSVHISRTFKAALIKLNLPIIRFHDLRHMCATLMMSMGIPDLYASAALGHGDQNITKIYQHIRDEERLQSEHKIDQFFLSQIG